MGDKNNIGQRITGPRDLTTHLPALLQLLHQNVIEQAQRKKEYLNSIRMIMHSNQAHYHFKISYTAISNDRAIITRNAGDANEQVLYNPHNAHEISQ